MPLRKAPLNADARISSISLQLRSNSVRFGKESEGMGDCGMAAMAGYCASSFLVWIQRLRKLLDSLKVRPDIDYLATHVPSIFQDLAHSEYNSAGLMLRIVNPHIYQGCRIFWHQLIGEQKLGQLRAVNYMDRVI
jgi:hypothetical protein